MTLSTIVVLVFTILNILDVPITALLILWSVVLVKFGLGAQNIINIFISSRILIWKYPIKTHDFLEVENTKGIKKQSTPEYLG
jgi:small-conductance mechanosensitive channel